MQSDSTRKAFEASLRGFLTDKAHDLDGTPSGGVVVSLAEVRRRKARRQRVRASA